MATKGFLCALTLAVVLPSSLGLFDTIKQMVVRNVYSFTEKDYNGNDVDMMKYNGSVLVIVNMPYSCGYASKYINLLNMLHMKLHSKGFSVLGFPSDQLNTRVPYNNGFKNHIDIISFIKRNKIKFDVFDKVYVNGKQTNDLWRYLKAKGGLWWLDVDDIGWNYTMFLINRNGYVEEKFTPKDSIQDFLLALKVIL